MRLLQAAGLPARRTGYHQVYGGTAVAGDVTCGDMRFEVKWRESLSKQLWEWLQGHDAVLLKRNRYPWLVLLPLDSYLELLTHHHHRQRSPE